MIDKDSISLLDCTLRDGGFALEDAAKNKIRTENFDEEQRRNVLKKLIYSGAEIIEVGAIEKTADSKKCFNIFSSIEDISRELVFERQNEQIFAAFFRGPDIDLKDIPFWEEGLIEAPRVCLRYSELDKSLDFCEELCKKGYKVFIQPMVTVRYSNDQIRLLIDRANDMGAYALYFVDSYGSMFFENVEHFYDLYNSRLNDTIKIGFHAHNNMEMAIANIIHLLDISENRGIIIDSCVTGMGQGTGNAQTEVLMNYFNKIYKKKYSLLEIFEICEYVNAFNNNQLWGYNSTRFIPAMNNTAYKYAMALRNEYNMSNAEIYDALCEMTDDLRYRYTPENTLEFLNRIKGID